MKVQQDILALMYQVLSVSPEMVQPRTFVNRLSRNPPFSRRILLVVVDEAHCISLWGADFRKKYAFLGIIRSFLPRQTPIIAMTATLTGRVRRDIQSKLHFAKGESIFYLRTGQVARSRSPSRTPCPHLRASRRPHSL